MATSRYVGIVYLDSDLIDRSTIESDLSVTATGSNYTEWLYSYKYKDLVEEGDQFLKVIELVDNLIVERYFLVNKLGYAIALIRRVISSTVGCSCSTYVYSTSILLARKCGRRVFPLKSAISYDSYIDHLGDIFTAILHNKKDRESFSTHMKEDDNNFVGWLDVVALQGWFPSAILHNLYIEEPMHTGWTLYNGAFSNEIFELNKSVDREFKPGNDVSERSINAICDLLSNSVLLDYKAVIKANTSEQMWVESLDVYDPLTGMIMPSNQLLYDFIHDEEISLTILVTWVCSYTAPILRGVSTFTVYRCLNDLLFIFINADDDTLPTGRLVIDYKKHMLVHYGYTDIPPNALMIPKHRAGV